MDKGTVKWFDELKGYGFITPDVGQKEVFVHKSNVDSMDQLLDKGDRVEFEVAEGTKGLEAKKVRVINEAK